MIRAALVLAAALCLGVPTPAQAAGDGPEISRSKGKKSGAVVLWPRVVPPSDDPGVQALAGQLQARLAAAVARELDGAPVDVRPAPERACPRDGCKGISVGAVLGHKAGGCVAVAFVSARGPEPHQVLPWAGEVAIFSPQVQFRSPPENAFEVAEFTPCSMLQEQLDDGPLAAAIADAFSL